MKERLSNRVISIPAGAVDWPFHGSPRVLTRPRNRKAYGYPVEVDPFPCYQHDVELVTEVAAKVESLFPMEWVPNYYVLGVEDLGRTNGHSNRHMIYSEGDDISPYEPYIVLSGKRIPLHPAMTRYLVAHEYGHLVHWYIERKRGFQDHGDEFAKEYAGVRGIEASFKYGARNWHSNIGELIANDFRICVCNIEPEFWPHEGFEHPDRLPEVKQFWIEQRMKFGWKGEETKAA